MPQLHAASDEMNTNVSSTLGERIRRRRRTLGISAADLADDVGVSRAYISQLENGHQDAPSLKVARRIASSLFWTFGDLLNTFTPIPVPEHVPEVLSEIAQEYSLTPEVISMLCSIHIEDQRPASRDDWLFLYLAIRQICCTGTKHKARVPVKPNPSHAKAHKKRVAAAHARSKKPAASSTKHDQ